MKAHANIRTGYVAWIAAEAWITGAQTDGSSHQRETH